MISLGVYRSNLSEKEMQDFAGVKFESRNCLGEFGCRQKGDHGKHFWFEQILLTDEISVPPRKDKPAKMPTTIRWFNFCYAYWQILLIAYRDQKQLTHLRAAQDALVYARLNCFDIDGSPSNIARSMQYDSYSKFNEMVSASISDLEAKVFKMAIKM